VTAAEIIVPLTSLELARNGDLLALAEVLGADVRGRSHQGGFVGSSLMLIADGRVLIAGRTAGDGTVASAMLYDPKTGAFRATGSMATPRRAAVKDVPSCGAVAAETTGEALRG
jgi:hypothetical protein